MDFVTDYVANDVTAHNMSFTIIEEHEMEIFPGVEFVEITGVSNEDANISCDTVDDLEGSELVCIYNKDEKSYKREKRENHENSLENIEIKILEIELLINTSTVEEVIFKKHNVQIIDKKMKQVVMEGVISGYKLVARSYYPDIVLEFDDGRTFYNDNFEYMLRFYI
jgi:hypothetical protein